MSEGKGNTLSQVVSDACLWAMTAWALELLRTALAVRALQVQARGRSASWRVGTHRGASAGFAATSSVFGRCAAGDLRELGELGELGGVRGVGGLPLPGFLKF